MFDTIKILFGKQDGKIVTYEDVENRLKFWNISVYTYDLDYFCPSDLYIKTKISSFAINKDKDCNGRRDIIKGFLINDYKGAKGCGIAMCPIDVIVKNPPKGKTNKHAMLMYVNKEMEVKFTDVREILGEILTLNQFNELYEINREAMLNIKI